MERPSEPSAASVAAGGVVATPSSKVFIEGFTHPVREYFLEDVLELTGYAIGKASKYAKKKGSGGGGGGGGALLAAPVEMRADADAATDAADADAVADADAADDAASPAPPVEEEDVPETWEETLEDRVAPTATATSDDATSASDTLWDTDADATRARARAAKTGAARADAAADDAARAKRDELAFASANLANEASYGEATRRSIANVDESLLNYELIERLIAKIIRVELSEGERALVAPSAAPGRGGKRSPGESDSKGAILVFLPGQAEINRLIRQLERSQFLEPHDVGELLFLPLYGALSGADQRKIFAPPPRGARKIVVATNIAETSVTIDDVRYVVDAGRAKEMRRVLFPHWFSYDRVRVVNADP